LREGQRLGSMPAMRFATISLLAGLAVTAAVGCGPSLDPAAKADIDARVAALRSGAGPAVPTPTGFQPMPFAVGQWVQYKMVNDSGEPSFLTQKVVGEESGAWWIESVMESYRGKTMQKMLVVFGSRTDPAQIEIRAAKTKDAHGRVNELPPSVMPMVQSIYKSVVASLVMSWQGLPQAPTAVPAGNFDGCFHTQGQVQLGGYKSTAESWSHPSVPLSGLVRSKGIDHPTTMELVGFGMSGATSEF
jgi:hypothetical protein